ncbi:MAG: hypothetical protein ABSB76_29570, partial [Streptosporangiaceae bacterium]
MRTCRARAVAASMLSLGCVTLALMTAGTAHASTRALADPLLTWSQPQPTGVTSEIKSVSCPSKKFCAAIDVDGQALTFNGTTWSAPVTIDTAYAALGSVSCSSATFCVAGDVYGKASYYNGSTWSALQTVAVGQGLGSVSCTSSTFCVAVDTTGFDAITYNGTNWSAPVV